MVKAFVREPEQQARFDDSADDLMAQQIQVSRVFSFLFPVIFLIANLGQAAILYFGGVQIINGTLTFGEWQKFSLYLIYVFFPLGQLGFIISQMSQAAASAQRIFEILDAKSDVANKPGAHRPAARPGAGRVRQRHLPLLRRRRAGPQRRQLYRRAGPDRGPAGRHRQRQEHDHQPDPALLRRQRRARSASTATTCATSPSNRCARRSASSCRIPPCSAAPSATTSPSAGRMPAWKRSIAAAKAAAAHDFILSFPEGYDTPVGERGTTLSGGQKQRLAIARALLMDPRILILDDSTSSVDTVTEYQIQQALDRLMKGRTSFVIAQRISTVRNADQILVLDKGQIVAQGKHDDLMENSAIYAEIYSSQLVEDARSSRLSATELTLSRADA